MLEIKDLCVTKNGDSTALLKGVSLALKKGQTLALVGESGSGKTLTALSVMGLLPPFFKTSGQIIYQDKNLLELAEDEIRLLRGKDIAYTLQNEGSLNPTLKIRKQLIEKPRAISIEQAISLLEQVGLKKEVMNLYPHQLSGGMRQRVLLAIALSRSPKILIADEPTSGLDYAVANQILDLLDELKKQRDLGLLLITHDLEIAASRADTITVMKDGCVVGANDPYAIELFGARL